MKIVSSTVKIHSSHPLNKLIEGCMEIETIYGQESSPEFTKQFANDLGKIKDFCIKNIQLEKQQAPEEQYKELFEKYNKHKT